MPQNENELLQDLIDKYARMYMKFAYEQGAPYDEAEGIVMDAFWCFYRSKHFGKLDERGTRLMLATIVKRKCIDNYRKNQCMETVEYEECEGELDKISQSAENILEAAMEKAETCRRVREEVEGLKDIWREPIKMYYLENRPAEEICQALGISYDTLRSRLSRARHCLEERLQDLKDEI